MKNEKVENLIKKEKERLDASKKQMRDKHLISLGLNDETKIIRIYKGEDGYNPDNAVYDKEKKKYYIETLAALDVTDEEYEEICKYYSPTQPEKEITKPKTTLNTVTEVTSNTESDKYTALNVYMKYFSVLGYIVIIAGIGSLIFFISERQTIIGVISIIASFIIAIPLLAFSNLLQVFIDIEHNTRNMLKKNM